MLVRHTLLAIAIVALTSMLTAPSASAVSVVTEPGGTPCSTATPPTNHGAGPGGCAVAFAGTGIEFGTALGMFVCNNAFVAKVGGSGLGYQYAQTLTQCTPFEVTPCESDELAPPAIWPMEFTSETTATIVSCIRFAGIRSYCTVFGLAVSQNASHTTTISTGPSHKFCSGSTANSIQGTWTSISTPAIEIAD